VSVSRGCGGALRQLCVRVAAYVGPPICLIKNRFYPQVAVAGQRVTCLRLRDGSSCVRRVQSGELLGPSSWRMPTALIVVVHLFTSESRENK
jgi:hypothetical protein